MNKKLLCYFIFLRFYRVFVLLAFAESLQREKCCSPMKLALSLCQMKVLQWLSVYSRSNQCLMLLYIFF